MKNLVKVALAVASFGGCFVASRPTVGSTIKSQEPVARVTEDAIAAKWEESKSIEFDADVPDSEAELTLTDGELKKHLIELINAGRSTSKEFPNLLGFAWGRRNPEDAIIFAQSIRSTEARKSFLVGTYRGWATVDGDAAWENFLMKQKNQNGGAALGILEASAAIGQGVLLESSNGYLDQNIADNDFKYLHSLQKEFTEAGIGAVIEKLGSRESSSLFLPLVTRSLAGKDSTNKDDLIRQISSLEINPAMVGNAIGAILNNVKGGDLSHTIDVLGQSEVPLSPEVWSRIAHQVANIDLDRGISILSGINDVSARDLAVSNVLVSRAGESSEDQISQLYLALSSGFRSEYGDLITNSIAKSRSANGGSRDFITDPGPNG